MKKTILFFLLFGLTFSSFSQRSNPLPALSKQDYLQKSKKQKTVARILVGGGLLLSGIGIAAAVGSVCVGCPEKPKDQSGWVILGSTMMVSSIPLLIIASNNKKKALRVSFKKQFVPMLQGNSFANTAITSLTLKINL